MTGAGDPVTVFAHGFASGIHDTRLFGSAVPGRRVFFQFRGHGRSELPAGHWGYRELAADLRAVADEFGATQVFGTSLGAGALCRLLQDTPDRFQRLVFFLPATLDQPRSPLTGEDLPDLLAAQIPPALRQTPGAQRYLQDRLEVLSRPDLMAAFTSLSGEAPLTDRAALGAVTAASLVIGTEGDPAHPASVARDLAAALARARLIVYEEPGAAWLRRAELRQAVSTFLAAG